MYGFSKILSHHPEPSTKSTGASALGVHRLFLRASELVGLLPKPLELPYKRDASSSVEGCGGLGCVSLGVFRV